MLDFGWSELVLIMALAVLVIGPKEIPALMLGLGRIVRRLQYVKYAFSRQFDEFMQDADMNDIRKSVNFEARDFNFDEAAADDDILAAPETKEKIQEAAEEKKDGE